MKEEKPSYWNPVHSRRYAENYGAFTALAGDIIPELWLLSREPHHSNSGPVERLTEFLFTRQSAKVSKVNAVPTVLYPRRSQPIADSAVAFDHQWCRTFSHPKVIFSRSVGGSPLPLRSVLVPVVMVFNKLSSQGKLESFVLAAAREWVSYAMATSIARLD